MMIFLELYIRFFMVGLFAVGGGLATLPFLTSMGETTGWFDAMDISNMVAISESTPGPIGINMATYIGFQVGSEMGMPFGIIGSIVASIGEVTPAIVIIIIVSKMLEKFRDSKYVEYTFYGLRAASVGLIAAAWLGVAKIAFWNGEAFAQSENLLMAVDYKSIILSAVIFFLATKFKKLHPVALIVLAAAVGIIFRM